MPDEGLAAVEAALGGAKVDLVVSDMAPNPSGIDAVDQARSMHLAELALDFVERRLQPGGDFAVKAFQGEGFDAFQRQVATRFDKAYVRKPEASDGTAAARCTSWARGSAAPVPRHERGIGTGPRGAGTGVASRSPAAAGPR